MTIAEISGLFTIICTLGIGIFSVILWSARQEFRLTSVEGKIKEFKYEDFEAYKKLKDKECNEYIERKDKEIIEMKMTFKDFRNEEIKEFKMDLKSVSKELELLSKSFIELSSYLRGKEESKE